MPDTPAPTPEPVVTGYIITVLTLALSAVGVNVADAWWLEVAAAALTPVVAAVAAYVTRKRVTPEITVAPRIEAAREQVKADIAALAPAATVYLPPAATVTDTVWEPAVPRPERYADPIPWAPTRVPPPADLDD